MARNVNVWFDNWQWTGVMVPTPQASVDLRIEWVDVAGNPHSHDETVKFPNILADVLVSWLKREVEILMLKALRKKLGVDPESIY